MVEAEVNIQHKGRGKGTKWIFKQLCIVSDDDEETTKSSKRTDISSSSSSHKRKSPRRSLSCNDVNTSTPKPTRKSLHNSHDGLVRASKSSKDKAETLQLDGRFSGDEQLPSLPENMSSFEIELTRVLNNRDCAHVFRRWCVAHHCEENMEFWVDVEILKQESGEEFKKRSESIYSKYLDPKAPFPINVDYDLTQKMGATLKRGEGLVVQDYIAAQESVFRLMENGCIKRFLESDSYRKWRETAESSRRRRLFGKRNHQLSNTSRTSSQGSLDIDQLFSRVK